MDVLWIPLGVVAVERGKRLLTIGFIVSCIFMLRLQVELMRSIGSPYGFFGFMKNGVFERGLIAYAFFIGLFLLLAYFSKGGDKNVHIAASITILIIGFCVSSLVMVL